MGKNLWKRRGETTPSNAGAITITHLTNRLRLAASHTHRRVRILILLVLSLFLYKTVRKSSVTLKHKGRLVVALSTIPSRIHLLQPTLESLLHQTKKPDVVYLTLPKKKAYTQEPLNYTLPPFIQQYQSNGAVQILSPEYDHGSIMKVLYVLEIEDSDTRIVYVDDDWLYHKDMVKVLYEKSLQHSHDALCFNGGMLRSYFRQISHTNLQHNHYPYLFMETSGTTSLLGGTDHVVDIAQGFCGVLVKPKFFELSTLLQLLQSSTLPEGVIKSDDFILSSHLEHQHVKRILVEGGTSPVLTQAAGVDKLSLYMYRHAMEAAYFLQNYWNIWQDYKFYNPNNLTKREWHAIDCEAGRGTNCDGYQNVLRELEMKYPPS